MTIDFSPGTQKTQQRLLARLNPEGIAWENKYNLHSNIGKLLLGLAAEFFRLSVLIEDVANETDINQTSQLILDWEKSVGIPDECLAATGALEDRRRNVLLKLTNFGGIQTARDFEKLAALFGFNAAVSNGVANSIFPLTFPIRFFDNRKAAVHTIIVNLEENKAVFPLEFPIQLTSGISGVIESLFEKLAPSNCQILFRYGAI